MSITKVGKNKYRIFISDGFNLDGSRRRFSKTITTDLKGRDLERFLILREIEFEEEVKKRDPQFHKLATGTFEEYSTWWLQHKVTHENMMPKTKTEYEGYLRNRILKYIGHKTLNKITTGDMLELMKVIKNSPAKTKSGRLSDKSIKNYHTLLKSMFSTAIELNILTENPMENVKVKAPKVRLKDNYYDLDDIKKLLELLPYEPIKYQLAVLIALSTGARIGEINGLQWKHVDLQNMKIKIEQAISYTKEKGLFVKEPKNENSIRTVTFPNYLVNLFLQHKEDEKLKMEVKGTDWVYHNKPFDDNFVFTQDNGKPIHIRTIPRWFRNFLRENDLKYITFHGLRHTNATILINEGISVVNVANNLGHVETSTTTNFYAHHLESVDEKIARAFDNMLEKKDSGTKGGSENENIRIAK